MTVPAPGPADSAEHWEVTGTDVPWTGAVTGVRSDTVRMPDGGTARRDYQLHPGSVAVVAEDERGRVLVLRQYRHPVRHKLWELPAGLLDVPGENPLNAARRELFEETHTEAAEWHVLADIFNSPGGSDEAVRIFLARGLTEATGERYAASGEEADLQLARVPLADLVAGVISGELHNGCLVAGILALHAARSAGGPAVLRPADAPWPARPFTP